MLLKATVLGFQEAPSNSRPFSSRPTKVPYLAVFIREGGCRGPAFHLAEQKN